MLRNNRYLELGRRDRPKRDKILVFGRTLLCFVILFEPVRMEEARNKELVSYQGPLRNCTSCTFCTQLKKVSREETIIKRGENAIYFFRQKPKQMYLSEKHGPFKELRLLSHLFLAASDRLENCASRAYAIHDIGVWAYTVLNLQESMLAERTLKTRS